MNEVEIYEHELLNRLISARQNMEAAYSECCRSSTFKDPQKLWQEFEYAEMAMNVLKDEIRKKLIHVKL